MSDLQIHLRHEWQPESTSSFLFKVHAYPKCLSIRVRPLRRYKASRSPVLALLQVGRTENCSAHLMELLDDRCGKERAFRLIITVRSEPVVTTEHIKDKIIGQIFRKKKGTKISA